MTKTSKKKQKQEGERYLAHWVRRLDGELRYFDLELIKIDGVYYLPDSYPVSANFPEDATVSKMQK